MSTSDINVWSLIKSGYLFCHSQGPVSLFKKLQESWEPVSPFYALFRDIGCDILKDAILCFLTLLRYVVGVYTEPA